MLEVGTVILAGEAKDLSEAVPGVFIINLVPYQRHHIEACRTCVPRHQECTQMEVYSTSIVVR